jgi:hypothetical protein
LLRGSQVYRPTLRQEFEQLQQDWTWSGLARFGPTTPTRARLPVMHTLWEASSEEALQERLRIGEKRLQHRRDRKGALVPPDEGQRPVAVPLDDQE